jgi:predicted NACHT family NTPase
MMSILNRNQELPRDRVRLYEQASRVLLHEWDTERALGTDPQLKDAIGYPEKAGILRQVADYMQHAPEGLAGNIIAREQLERILRES